MQDSEVIVKLVHIFPGSKYVLRPPNLCKTQESSIVQDYRGTFKRLQPGKVMALLMCRKKSPEWNKYKHGCRENGTVSSRELVKVENYREKIFATGAIVWRAFLKKGEDLTDAQKKQCPTWAETAAARKLRWREKEKSWKNSKNENARMIVWCLGQVTILEHGVEIKDADIVEGSRRLGWCQIKQGKEREVAAAARRTWSRAGSPQV